MNLIQAMQQSQVGSALFDLEMMKLFGLVDTAAELVPKHVVKNHDMWTVGTYPKHHKGGHITHKFTRSLDATRDLPKGFEYFWMVKEKGIWQVTLNTPGGKFPKQISFSHCSLEIARSLCLIRIRGLTIEHNN